jgi:probable rRNA maturation factor|tara:strand:+ start:758 stop:1228 length:471 start_codon:yes stop_codon:yes gene_type:complete
MKKEKNNLLIVKILKNKCKGYIPSKYKITKWAKTSFFGKKHSIVSIKIATKNEISILNKKFFKKNTTCNILSFPHNSIISSGEYILGDIIICADVVNKESTKYKINNDNRWAHMVIHSMLHLQGYAHHINEKKIIMEKKEINLMNILGYQNPYYAN